MMKKILENLYIIVFMIIIFGILIASIIEKDKVFSDYENRTLQQFPKLNFDTFFDGTFQSQFDTYTSDQIIFKNQIVKTKNYLDIIQLKIAINGVYNASDDFFVERHSKKDYDIDKLNQNISFLNDFVKKYNAEVYLIPNASTILNDKLIYTEEFDFNKYMSNIENIDYVDNILKSYEGNSSDLYYKTDHHWTTIGAYQLYKNIVENPVDLNLKAVNKEFFGTINNKLNINMNPDTIYINDSNTNFSVYYDTIKKDLGLYFDNHLETKDKYAYFLDANHGLVEIINEDIDNDEKVLIIKDSYANCFAPLLAESYKQVDVLDFRYFNMPLSGYLKMVNYDRIIILYNKDGFANNNDFFKINF